MATKAKSRKCLCDTCSGLCCRYICLPIDEPETREDFDDLRWYLTHENIEVHLCEGTWYLQVRNRCRHLDQAHRCAIYPKRPRICREYKASGCDRTPAPFNYDLHFADDAQMEAYMRIRFDNEADEIRRATGVSPKSGRRSASGRK